MTAKRDMEKRKAPCSPKQDYTARQRFLRFRFPAEVAEAETLGSLRVSTKEKTISLCRVIEATYGLRVSGEQV